MNVGGLEPIVEVTHSLPLYRYKQRTQTQHTYTHATHIRTCIQKCTLTCKQTFIQKYSHTHRHSYKCTYTCALCSHILMSEILIKLFHPCIVVKLLVTASAPCSSLLLCRPLFFALSRCQIDLLSAICYLP